jgi:hypothetical protein
MPTRRQFQRDVRKAMDFRKLDGSVAECDDHVPSRLGTQINGHKSSSHKSPERNLFLPAPFIQPG